MDKPTDGIFLFPDPKKGGKILEKWQFHGKSLPFRDREKRIFAINSLIHYSR